MGHPWPLFHLFSVLFKQTLQILQQMNVKNVHPVPGIRFQAHPCDYKSPPLTTRPLECYSYLIDAGEFHLVEDWDEEVADDDQREAGRQEPREWEQPTMVGYFSRYTYIGQVGRSSDTFSTILSWPLCLHIKKSDTYHTICTDVPYWQNCNYDKIL